MQESLNLVLFQNGKGQETQGSISTSQTLQSESNLVTQPFPRWPPGLSGVVTFIKFCQFLTTKHTHTQVPVLSIPYEMQIHCLEIK